MVKSWEGPDFRNSCAGWEGPDQAWVHPGTRSWSWRALCVRFLGVGQFCKHYLCASVHQTGGRCEWEKGGQLCLCFQVFRFLDLDIEQTLNWVKSEHAHQTTTMDQVLIWGVAIPQTWSLSIFKGLNSAKGLSGLWIFRIRQWVWEKLLLA